MVDQLIPSAEQLEQRLPAMRRQLSQTLRQSVPQMVDQLMPAAEQAKAQLPELRKQLEASMKAAIPGMMDEVMAEADRLKQRLPEVRRQMAQNLKDAIPRMMDQLEPRMDELRDRLPEVRAEFAQRLKDAAPGVMADLKPRLAEAKDKIPEIKEELARNLTEQAPVIADMLRDQIVQTALPEARRMLAQATMQRLDEELPRLSQVVDDAVRLVVEQHLEDIKTLEREDLSQELQVAFEEAAGPVLDEFSAGVEQGIEDVKDRLRVLIAKAESGRELTRKEQLELRYIQLWKTYWNVRMVQQEP
jgi:ABC-type transporter Mla subunit MlaD